MEPDDALNMIAMTIPVEYTCPSCTGPETAYPIKYRAHECEDRRSVRRHACMARGAQGRGVEGSGQRYDYREGSLLGESETVFL